MLEKDCLVVAISVSGKTKDVLDAVSIAKQNEVPIVCITANPNSPIAKISDKVLISCSSGDALSKTSTENRMSQIAITEALCAYIRYKLDETGVKRCSKICTILQTHNIQE